jgi:hypothetical protein
VSISNEFFLRSPAHFDTSTRSVTAGSMSYVVEISKKLNELEWLRAAIKMKLFVFSQGFNTTIP